ncbi:hypothetical protein [Paraburkholderia humisilvae]|uniref:Uncharacterized protein n=1 Tax=Paraburkholderia humisilvae TaxID=627669 RepID=A0A6J5F6P7_9BURK|nr:hypothetical protein [Paraburkholderia humisilvae]CAB3774550.1 hypothetical protein LMG29542_07927 [Paraburkholderia humisilvae]
MNIATVGLDLAKNVLQVHAVDLKDRSLYANSSDARMYSGIWLWCK